jgi:hypothetical protein
LHAIRRSRLTVIPENQRKSKVGVMPCAASASPQVVLITGFLFFRPMQIIHSSTIAVEKLGKKSRVRFASHRQLPTFGRPDVGDYTLSVEINIGPDKM